MAGWVPPHEVQIWRYLQRCCLLHLPSLKRRQASRGGGIGIGCGGVGIGQVPMGGKYPKRGRLGFFGQLLTW